MATSEDVVGWVFAAIDKLRDRADLVNVAREIWGDHEDELRKSGNLFYTWQNTIGRVAPWLDDPDRVRHTARFDVFISHAHADAELAARVESSLQAHGLSVWLDKSDIGLGGLLRSELQHNIRNSRTMILLWSEHAAASRWVSTEWLMAFHQGRFILPCVTDEMPLLEWLGEPVWLDLRNGRLKDGDAVGTLLCRAVKEAPPRPNDVMTFPRRGAPADSLIPDIYRAQEAVLNLKDDDEARREQRRAEALLLRARTLSPKDPYLIVMDGYQKKNEYFLEYRDAVTVGRPPRDPLLEEAERLFLQALAVDPRDTGAINGLGSVLVYRRELEAAEFFIRRAIGQAEKIGTTYEDAESDLRLIESIKRQMVREGK